MSSYTRLLTENKLRRNLVTSCATTEHAQRTLNPEVICDQFEQRYLSSRQHFTTSLLLADSQVYTSYAGVALCRFHLLAAKKMGAYED